MYDPKICMLRRGVVWDRARVSGCWSMVDLERTLHELGTLLWSGLITSQGKIIIRGLTVIEKSKKHF